MDDDIDSAQPEVKKNNDYTNVAKFILLILVIVMVLYLTYKSTISGGTIIAANIWKKEGLNKSKTWGSGKRNNQKHVKFDLRKSTVMKFNKNDKPIDLRKNNKLMK